MKMLLTAAFSLVLTGWAVNAHADPDKDESGKSRWRGGYERSYGHARQGYRNRNGRPPLERRAFKQEYDDGNCKYERKLEKSGEYKEEVKCRGGRRAYPAYGYRSLPSYGDRY